MVTLRPGELEAAFVVMGDDAGAVRPAGGFAERVLAAALPLVPGALAASVAGLLVACAPTICERIAADSSGEYAIVVLRAGDSASLLDTGPVAGRALLLGIADVLLGAGLEADLLAAGAPCSALTCARAAAVSSGEYATVLRSGELGFAGSNGLGASVTALAMSDAGSADGEACFSEAAAGLSGSWAAACGPDAGFCGPALPARSAGFCAGVSGLGSSVRGVTGVNAGELAERAGVPTGTCDRSSEEA